MRDITKTVFVPVNGKEMGFRLTKMDSFSGIKQHHFTLKLLCLRSVPLFTGGVVSWLWAAGFVSL